MLEKQIYLHKTCLFFFHIIIINYCSYYFINLFFVFKRQEKIRTKQKITKLTFTQCVFLQDNTNKLLLLL